MSLTLALFATLFAAPPVDATAISNVRVSASHIVLNFDGPVDGASAFLLDGPRRIAVDVAGASPGRAAAAALNGPVTRARQGQFSNGTARVVFDLSAPAIVTGGALSSDRRSLTLGLRPVTQVAFTSAARVGARQVYDRAADNPSDRGDQYAFRARPPKGGDKNSVSIPLDPPVPIDQTPLPPVTGTRASNRPLVVIDAGHGGHDPGSISVFGQRQEKAATLAIAKAIRDELVKSGRVRVALTRDDDTFLPLPERVAVARRLKADLFISIHADSAPNPDAHGATVYTLSDVASDKEAARLAAAENKSDIINGVDLGAESSDVQSILLDLSQRETMNVSAQFASLLQRETSSAVSFRSDAHRFAGFRVLKAADTPSVLFETGYMTNIGDAQFLFSRPGQRAIAEGVRRAIETHFAKRLASGR
nr:N-acetylmuramoyl-L-alanine amidase [Sphingomonas formosensis]